jgi:hypothetical protein
MLAGGAVIMGTLLILLVGVVVLVFVIKFAVGKFRAQELDRDFSIDLACSRVRALDAAATAARGVLWEVEFTDNGLRTRHIRARNVVHVAISDHPCRPDRCSVKVWTRYRWADGVFILRPQSYLDTKRKRDKIRRTLGTYSVPAGRDATIG